MININNKIKKKFDIPKSHYNKISVISKIPIKRNVQMKKQKNNIIKNKNNNFNNYIIRSNSYLCKNEQNKTYLISYNNNYYKLNNQNNQLENIYNYNKNKNRIIITDYNSFSNNILSIPSKISLFKNKNHIFSNKNMTLNYNENPALVTNLANEPKNLGAYLYNKKIMKDNKNNKSKDKSNLLTECELKVNNKTLNLNKKKNEKNVKKQINNDRIRNRNYIRNFSYKSLILNPFKSKENNFRRILTNKSSKTKLVINPNKNQYFIRSCNCSAKKIKIFN